MLGGVRVVALGGGVACAFAGRWLAALGAEVMFPHTRSARGELRDVLHGGPVLDGTGWSAERWDLDADALMTPPCA
jgi:hypothetical protein